MEYTFPDSGRKIEIERVAFTTLSLLRAHYENNLNHKPVAPFKKDNEGELTDLPDEKDPKYVEALNQWNTGVQHAVFLATKVLYVKHLKSEVDFAALKELEDETKELGIDMRKEVREEYAKAGVPFDESLMDKYLYLYCVCVTNVAESQLLNQWMSYGSQPTQEAVQRALYSFRG